MTRYILIIGALFCSVFAQAQSPEIFEEMKAKYPTEMAVYLDLHQEVKLDIEGDSLLITVDEYQDRLHLDDRSKALASDKIFLSHFKELLLLEAETLVPNKKRFKSIKVTDYKEKNETSSGIFYDDFRSKTFVYPAVAPGVITRLHEKQALTNPRFLTSFYFGSFLPVRKTYLKITFHKDIDLQVKKFNTENIDFKFTEESKGNYKIYTWEASDLEGYEIESRAPKSNYYLPHLAYHIASYKGESGEKRILADVADLYGWYSGLTCNINQQEDQELKELAEKLTEGVVDEEEKVRRLFYWVQDKIKYIAFEDGMRGFIPHNANYVFSKRYGDCKDMASITNNLLKLAGIKSHLTWIGSRDLPYRYSELPTPMVDNHMIVSYRRPNGELYFLDATSSYTQYGYPSSMIQGKEALLDLGDGKYEIAEVPVIPKEKNQVADKVSLKLEDGKIKGSGKLDLSGYVRVFNSYRITGSGDEKEDRFMDGFLQKGSNKCFVEDYEVLNVSDKEKPLSIEYKFYIEDYHQELGNEIYLDLNLEKPLNNDLIKLEERELPIENDYHYVNRLAVEFEVPEGYKVTYLPSEVSYENELFGFSIAYKQEGNKVYQERNIYKNFLLLEKESFADWNAMVKAISKAYREVIILEK